MYKYLSVNSDVTDGQGSVLRLKNKLKERISPSRTVTSRNVEDDINITKTLYLLYIELLIDYNALKLARLEDTFLKTLETYQNEAMRIKLGYHNLNFLLLLTE